MWCSWDKPDSHIVEAMESRLKDIDLASERSLKVSLGLLALCHRHDFTVFFFFAMILPNNTRSAKKRLSATSKKKRKTKPSRVNR